MTLEIGTPAPDFTLPDQDGNDIALSDLRGAPVVLFFYPKDDTPGCTIEANEISDMMSDFDKTGVKVFGISKDSQRNHQNFIQKHDLKTTLLSDADSDVCELYGVWAEKKMYGKTFMGINRTSFLIDGEGRIAQVWEKVKPEGHAQELLSALKDAT
ncbi:thioredoxin-dependent thiol peroxidase [Paracoccaceae bacterium GXU_MW_L88]